MQVCNKRNLKSEGWKLKLWKLKTKGFRKGFNWKGFEFGFYGGIKFIRCGLYGGEKARIDFIFISILNFKIHKNYFKIVE